jgi:endonuclease V-like protein UPF0215 family
MRERVKFYKVKEEIRILGIDDAPFTFEEDQTVMIVGAIFRGGTWLDGVMSSSITVDGDDATEKIIEMVKNTRHKDLRIVMLDGLTFGGFNMVDIQRVYEEGGLPVIVIVRNHPNFEDIKEALKNLENAEKRYEYIRKAGEPHRTETKKGNYIYIQIAGIELEDAQEIVRLSATRSLIPEPIRAAHLIGQGIVLGESRGRA